MLNEDKIRQKIKELGEQRLYNYTEWLEEGTPIGEHSQVTDGMTTEPLQFRLEELSATTVKLYLNVNHVFVGIMVFDKDF